MLALPPPRSQTPSRRSSFRTGTRQTPHRDRARSVASSRRVGVDSAFSESKDPLPPNIQVTVTSPPNGSLPGSFRSPSPHSHIEPFPDGYVPTMDASGHIDLLPPHRIHPSPSLRPSPLPSNVSLPGSSYDPPRTPRSSRPPSVSAANDVYREEAVRLRRGKEEAEREAARLTEELIRERELREKEEAERERERAAEQKLQQERERERQAELEREAKLARELELERELRELEERERLERERLERERLERDRLEREQERLERERLEQERLEQERLERERIEKERLEQERLEKERLEKERLEKERLEKERLEKERLEKERLEKERLEKERLEKERLEKERLEKERLEKERLEKERLEKEGLEKERLEKERLEEERLEMERLDRERLEKERVEKERVEMERVEMERLERERLEKERIERDRIEQERVEQERLGREHLEKELERERERQREQERIEKGREEARHSMSQDIPRDEFDPDGESEDEDEVTADETVTLPYPTGSYRHHTGPPRKRNAKSRSVTSHKTGQTYKTAGAASTPLSTFSVLVPESDMEIRRQRIASENEKTLEALRRREQDELDAVNRPSMDPHSRAGFNGGILPVIREQPSTSELNGNSGREPNTPRQSQPQAPRTPHPANPILPIRLDRGPPDHIANGIGMPTPGSTHHNLPKSPSSFSRVQNLADDDSYDSEQKQSQRGKDHGKHPNPWPRSTTPGPLANGVPQTNDPWSNSRPANTNHGPGFPKGPNQPGGSPALPPLPQIPSSPRQDPYAPINMTPGLRSAYDRAVNLQASNGAFEPMVPGSPATSVREGKPVDIPIIHVERPTTKSKPFFPSSLARVLNRRK
ncbi:hypothetical protein BS47DRAFT_1190938 [Hydnum rufescens UP504]|uniref:Uncharacterized protein n=1 Tax=Hydnum rufescens UP504 TaxID=1448309 RepID=A0A9P6DRL9_9AGAM|nr:hypothetical protein BS47DRAFT_1190938 [Hydnum rufescens UP504]